MTAKNTSLIPIYLLSALLLSGLYYFLGALMGGENGDRRAWQCSTTTLVVLGLFLLLALGRPRAALAFRTFVLSMLVHGAIFGVLAVTFGKDWIWISDEGYEASVFTPPWALMSGWAVGVLVMGVALLIRRSSSVPA